MNDDLVPISDWLVGWQLPIGLLDADGPEQLIASNTYQLSREKKMLERELRKRSKRRARESGKVEEHGRVKIVDRRTGSRHKVGERRKRA